METETVKEVKEKLTNNLLFRTIHNKTYYYALKRAWGKTITEGDIDTVIAYRDAFDHKSYDSTKKQNARMVVAELCYNTLPFNADYSTYHPVRFEVVIGRLYKKEAGTDRVTTTQFRIHQFLDTSFDNPRYFISTFCSIANRVKSELNPNETFNYEQLLWDLYDWGSSKVKNKWIDALVS